MSRRRTIWDHFRWDLLALTILGVLAFGYGALQEPRLELAESPRGDGSRPPDRTEGDILLVLPTTPAAAARSFDTLDCSYSWFNALWHQFGSFATAPADTLSPQLLAGHAAVVVPARVAAELSRPGREVLERFVRDGGQLIVEMPRDGWDHITGISTAGELRQARQITAVEGLGVYGPMREHLVDVPLNGRLLPSAELAPRPGGPVVFEVEEQPGMVIQPLGSGKVHSLLFDFACSLTAMHQGKPTREMEFGPPGSKDWLPTSERVAHERLLSAHVPYADLLQKAVFRQLADTRPIPRLWPFPGNFKGALMTMHPAEGSPRGALGYADWSRKNDASSSILGTADRFTPHHVALAREVDAQLGLVWVIGEERAHLTDSFGFGAIQPWARELSLPQQKARLEASIGGGTPLRLVRTEGGLWQTDWSSTFRTLAGAGLRVDTSFGPATATQFGYLFGTGMPYYPLDDRGLVLPIVEAPFVLSGASISESRLRRMLGNSRSAFHQPLLVNLPADAMAQEPSAGILLGFRSLHEMGQEFEHWLTTISDFTDFLGARRQSVLTSQWSTAEHRLTISVNLLGARLATAPDGAVASVAIHRQFQGQDIVRIEVADESVRIDRLESSGSNEELLLDLEPGRHVISVFYDPPSSESEKEEP